MQLMFFMAFVTFIWFTCVSCSGDGIPVWLEGPGWPHVHWDFAGLHSGGSLCAGPQVALITYLVGLKCFIFNFNTAYWTLWSDPISHNDINRLVYDVWRG